MSENNKNKQEFTSIAEVANKIKSDLSPEQSDAKKLVLLYAFNSTGKTRLSVEFEKINEESEPENLKVLSYNAFLEDLFVWDNDEFVLRFSPHYWLFKFIKDQGLEREIVDSFKTLTNSKTEPEFDFEKGEVVFQIATGDNEAKENIKISRSEESLLVWVIYFSVLELVIDELKQEKEERSIEMFNDLEFIVIDDPVSSIDDERIVSSAVKLAELIKNAKDTQLRFLVNTHHALFFNVLFNSFRRKKYSKSYIFSKADYGWVLEKQPNDSPFAYHILIIEKIKEAIKNDALEKYHFNLFRTLLEKTANFLGYNNWSDCVDETNRQEVVRLVNLYSHSKLSELEGKKLGEKDKELLRVSFERFLKDFKFNSGIWKKETKK